jgi:hypothetical protein
MYKSLISASSIFIDNCGLGFSTGKGIICGEFTGFFVFLMLI